MIVKVSDLIGDIADLLDDPDQDFTTDKYILPKIRVAQRRLITTMLENPNIGEILGEAVVPNVPIGTRSLNAMGAFSVGAPLQTLNDPITLEEKVAGYGDEQYVLATQVARMPPVIPGQLNQLWGWLGQDIVLLGATGAVDIRVFGVFEPQPITSVDSVLVPGTAAIIQFRVASLIAGLRGNAQLRADYKNDADEAEDQHFIHLIMARQSIPIRHLPYPRTSYDLRYI